MNSYLNSKRIHHLGRQTCHIGDEALWVACSEECSQVHANYGKNVVHVVGAASWLQTLLYLER